jgi:uncharacterized membrane protein
MFYQFAQFYGNYPNHYMMRDGGGWFSLASFILCMLVIIAASIVVYRLLYAKHGMSPTHHSDPLEAAKLRYAKGEITEEEFVAIKRNLAA